MRPSTRRFFALLPALLASCQWLSPGEPDTGPVEPPFAFAVLADSHLTTDAGRQARLAQLVQWINIEGPAHHIELVLVVGDIAWGEGVAPARDVLRALNVPWAPLIGDNDVVFGSEEAFDQILGPQIDALAPVVGDLRRAPRPVRLAVPDKDALLQNFGFTWRGIRFIGLDFASRQDGTVASELGELHDVPGGSREWLAREISTHPEARAFVLASHIPMHNGIFDPDEMKAIATALEPRRHDILVNVAGHMHLNYDTTINFPETTDRLYDVWVTAATWTDTKAIRIGLIQTGTDGIEITQELVDVPM